MSASKGAAIGSYLDALPGKTFESVAPAVKVTTTASVVKSDASSVSGTSVSVAAGSQSGIPGKSTSSGFTGKPVSSTKPKPVAGKSGLGSYLDALPGKTFISPAIVISMPTSDLPSLSGTGGYHGGIPGKSMTPTTSGKPVSSTKPKPVAGKSGLGSYLDALSGKTFITPEVGLQVKSYATLVNTVADSLLSSDEKDIIVVMEGVSKSSIELSYNLKDVETKYDLLYQTKEQIGRAHV